MASELPLWIASAPEYAFGKTDGIQSEREILQGGERFGASLEERSERLMRGFLESAAGI